MSLVGDLLDSYVKVETAKVNSRLNSTGQQQQAFNIPSQSANAQAKARSFTARVGNNTLLMGGALLVVVVAGIVLLRR